MKLITLSWKPNQAEGTPVSRERKLARTQR